MKPGSIGCIALCIAASSSMAFAASLLGPGAQTQMSASSGPNMTIPLQAWAVDSNSFATQLNQSRHGMAKAATDRATVYRPLAPCRLIDTRGFSAAIAVAGPLGPNTGTNINSAGFCGIPNNGLVTALSVSFHVFNNTVNNGGYIAFQQQGAPINGVNAVFNTGAQWTAATANISIPNDSGNFSIYIANSQVQVIVDVNGYYQDLDSLDVGTQELDINGSTGGDLFQITNSGSGSALSVFSSTGAAITVFGGSVRASGAGVGTNTFATIHQVNTAGNFGAGGTLCSGGFPDYTVLDNTLANGDPNAILQITPATTNTGGAITTNTSFQAYYLAGAGCASALANDHWLIRAVNSAALPNNLKFHVLIIKP